MRSSSVLIASSVTVLLVVGSIGIGSIVVSNTSRASHEAIMREKDATIAFACGYVAAQRSASPNVNEETSYCRTIRETAIRNGFTTAQ